MDLALVDAVMSIRFRYGRAQPDGTWSGARGAVLRYQRHSADVPSEKRMEHLADQDPVKLELILNRQKVRAGKTKASAIVEAARSFTAIGVTQPRDLDPANPEHRAQYTGVSGLGPVTWEYFTMLLRHDGVKADTWITEFVSRALGRTVTPGHAGGLVKDAAMKLGMEQTSLDHAIWSYASTSRLQGVAKVP